MPNDNETRTIEHLEDEIRRLRLENIELRDNVQELKSRLAYNAPHDESHATNGTQP